MNKRSVDFLMWAIRIAVILIGILPGACHFYVTAPPLWSHQSSAAFSWWLLLWIISIGIFFSCVWLVIQSHKGDRS